MTWLGFWLLVTSESRLSGEPLTGKVRPVLSRAGLACRGSCVRSVGRAGQMGSANPISGSDKSSWFLEDPNYHSWRPK
jgi:hypothetical protein